MGYSTQKLQEIAQTDPQELIKIINNHYKIDIKTMALAIEILGEEVEDETIVFPMVIKLLKHVHVLLREGAILCALSFYSEKKLPQEIVDRLKILAKNDPSSDIRDLAGDTLKDFGL
jgi:HEAT repeat protein